MQLKIFIRGSSEEFGRVGQLFLAALQNSNFFSKWGYFYTILSVLTGNALEMLCVNRFLFRKDNISVFL